MDKKAYFLGDSHGILTSDEILNSDDEELQNDFYKYLDKENGYEDYNNDSDGLLESDDNYDDCDEYDYELDGFYVE